MARDRRGPHGQVLFAHPRRTAAVRKGTGKLDEVVHCDQSRGAGGLSLRALDKLSLRLRSLFRRNKVEGELEDELRFHLDQLVDEMISAGVPSNKARQAALRSMGSIVQFQDECRDMRRVNLWEDFLRDIGYAWRSWTRTPFFFLS